MDGVLADFILKFNRLAKELYQLDLPTEWNKLHPHGDGQLTTDEQYHGVMNRMLGTPHMWFHTDEINKEDVETLAYFTQKCKILAYFTTAREDTISGSWTDSATYQTKLWLTSRGIDPTGVIARKFDRVNLLKELGVDYHLDDNPELFTELTEAGINCWLRDQSYNQHIVTDKRVKSVKEFLSRIPY